MRLRDGLVLIPVEIAVGLHYPLLAAAALLLLSGVGRRGYTLEAVRTTGLPSAALMFLTFFGGAILGPLLLPWLPGRAFALKGATLGLAPRRPRAVRRPVDDAVACRRVGVVHPRRPFVVMNFTGTSTFTSLSGVLREMRVALPAQLAGAALGLGLWVTGLFQTGGVRA